MKEAKFRVWDPNRNEFFYFGFIGESFVDLVYDQTLPLDYVRENCEQYTGLKDKNGKEIYENDIIEVFIGSYSRAIVEFCSGTFCYKWINRNDKTPIYLTPEYKIIGNIHENPELLK